MTCACIHILQRVSSFLFIFFFQRTHARTHPVTQSFSSSRDAISPKVSIAPQFQLFHAFRVPVPLRSRFQIVDDGKGAFGGGGEHDRDAQTGKLLGQAHLLHDPDAV